MALYQPGHSHADTFNFLLNYMKEILAIQEFQHMSTQFRLIERFDSHIQLVLIILR